MIECPKSCRDSVKLTVLALAISLGLMIHTHVGCEDDQKSACFDFLVESSELEGLPA